MAVTLRQIAEASGVSPPVVSQILNQKGQRFREETRNRVLETARRLGYRPNALARGMVSGRFGCLALLLTSDRYYSHLPPALLNGIQKAVMRNDLHLTIAQLPDEKLTSQGFVPKILREYLADGMLVNYHFHVPRKMEELIEEYHLPAVWINVKRDWDCVYPDEQQAGEQATAHLLGLGHRRIALVDYSHGRLALPTSHYSAVDRCTGYMRAMQKSGLTPREIRADGKSVPYIERQAFSRSWLSADDRPSAIVSYSTDAAGPVILAAARLGLAVPQDLSVVTVDERPSHVFGAPLTTMVIPNERMGDLAVESLLERVAGPSRRLEPRVLSFDLVPGQSCAPVTGPA